MVSRRVVYSAAFGPLAQLAEQLTLNQQVTGSIPVRLTSKQSNGGSWGRVMEMFSTAIACPLFAVGVEANNYGEVSELADEHDLGSCAARRRSSSLLFPTKPGDTILKSIQTAS